MSPPAFRDPYVVEWTPGKVLSLLGAVGVYASCILLPLVGPSARRVPHYWPENVLTFLGVWLVGTVLSALAWRVTRRERGRGRAASPLPALGCLVVQGVLLVVFAAPYP